MTPGQGSPAGTGAPGTKLPPSYSIPKGISKWPRAAPSHSLPVPRLSDTRDTPGTPDGRGWGRGQHPVHPLAAPGSPFGRAQLVGPAGVDSDGPVHAAGEALLQQQLGDVAVLQTGRGCTLTHGAPRHRDFSCPAPVPSPAQPLRRHGSPVPTNDARPGRGAPRAIRGPQKTTGLCSNGPVPSYIPWQRAQLPAPWRRQDLAASSSRG